MPQENLNKIWNAGKYFEPKREMYRGLAEMYVADERFKQNYKKVAVGLAEYMKEGMMKYAEEKSKN